MLLTSIFAATPDNPTFNLNDPQAWDTFVDGDPASTGVAVNDRTSLGLDTWWRGINLISRDVGKLPMITYLRHGEGKIRDTKHPAYHLLRRRANEYQSALEFRQLLTAWTLSHGNGYAYIQRRGDGAPLELWPLPPSCTFPVRENSRLWYVTDVAGEQRKLPATDVLHIRGFSTDGLIGVNVVQIAKESLGLGLGARKWSAIFFKNSARAPVVLETPNKLDPKAKDYLRENWEKMYRGLDNAHRTAVLDNGLKANQVGFSAEDSRLIETRKFNTREVANFLNLPPHKLGDREAVSYNSLEQENLSYLVESLDYWLCLWEEECQEKLLTEDEKASDSHAVEFLRQALVRADLGARSTYYQRALGNRPWMVQNEVRALENLDPVAGGDELPPAAAAPPALPPGKDEEPGTPEDERTPPPPPKKPAQEDAKVRVALGAALAEAVGRMVRRIGADARRAAREPRTFTTWIDEIGQHHEAVMREALAPIEGLCRTLRESGSAGACTPFADWLLGRLKAEFLDLADRATPAQLQQATIDLADSLAERLPAEAAERML